MSVLRIGSCRGSHILFASQPLERVIAEGVSDHLDLADAFSDSFHGCVMALRNRDALFFSSCGVDYIKRVDDKLRILTDVASSDARVSEPDSDAELDMRAKLLAIGNALDLITRRVEDRIW